MIKLWIESEGKSLSIADLSDILENILLPSIEHYYTLPVPTTFDARLFAFLSSTQALFQTTLLFSFLSQSDCSKALQQSFLQLAFHLIHLQQRPLSIDTMSLLLHLLSYILQHPIKLLMSSSSFPVQCLSNSLSLLGKAASLCLSPTEVTSESRYVSVLLQLIRICHSSSELSINQESDLQEVLLWITARSRPMTVANEAMSSLRVILKVYHSDRLSSLLLPFLQWSYDYLHAIWKGNDHPISVDQVSYVIEILRVSL